MTDITHFGFRAALGAFFHARADKVVPSLPAGVRPLEFPPGLAVLALTVLDFDESEVGPYCELVASIVVIPWAAANDTLPDASLFPILLATNTEVSRSYVTERWRLPQLDCCLDIQINDEPGRRTATVTNEGRAVLRLGVATRPLVATQRHYQCYTADADNVYRIGVEIVGPLCEHEDELGTLELSDHPIARQLAGLIEDPIPFREQSMDAGIERFSSSTLHAPHRRPA